MISIEKSDDIEDGLDLEDINATIFTSTSIDDGCPNENGLKVQPIRLLSTSANQTGTPQRLTSIVEDVEAEKRPALMTEEENGDVFGDNHDENLIPVPDIEVQQPSVNGSTKFEEKNHHGSFMDLPFFQVPKHLMANRQSVTVGDSIEQFFLIERKKKEKPQPSSYWTKKKREEPKTPTRGKANNYQKQFSLHTVPSNVSLKWIETTGQAPNPAVALKYEPPSGIAGNHSQSNFSIASHNFRPMDKKDVLYSSSIFDLNHYESKLYGLADLGEASRRDLTDPGKGDQPQTAPALPGKKTTLLRSPSFLGYCFTNALFIFGMFSPLVFIIRWV